MKYRFLALFLIAAWFCSSGGDDPLKGVREKEERRYAAVRGHLQKELQALPSKPAEIIAGDGFHTLYIRAGVDGTRYPIGIMEEDFIRRNGGKMPRLWPGDPPVKVPDVNCLAQR